MRKLNNLHTWLKSRGFVDEAAEALALSKRANAECGNYSFADVFNDFILKGEVVRKGSEGPQVGYLQETLEELGYTLPQYGVDCDFGSETERSLNRFKKDNSLPENGTLDAVTIFRLNVNSILGVTREPEAAPEASSSLIPSRRDSPLSGDGVTEDFTYRGRSYTINAEEPRVSSKHEEIRAGSNVHRYRQPTLGELKWFVETAGVTNVVRMNGDGGDTLRDSQTGLSMTRDLERAYLNHLGAEFVFVNAHDDYVRDQGYVGSLQTILPKLEAGNVLIHCLGGRDRTGYTIAAFLKRNTGMTNEELWEYTTSFNNWERHICSGGKTGYAKYLDGFYPLTEFCEAHPSCAIC